VQFLFGLIVGLIIGWIVEWLIDWRFWRKDMNTVISVEGQLRESLADAHQEVATLTSELHALEARLQATQAELAAAQRALSATTAAAPCAFHRTAGRGVTPDDQTTYTSLGANA
jgi:hypothetical protein